MDNSNNFPLVSGVVNQGIRWWARAVLRQGIVVWDLETTGMSGKDQPIEIALVDGLSGVYLFQSLIYTDVPIHPKAQEVHNISAEMLVGKPSFSKVFEIVNKILNGRDSATYNAAFDTRLWAQAGGIFPGEVWCLMEAYKIYAGLPRKVSLDTACRQLEVEEKNTHRSLQDARTAAALLQKMAEGVVPNMEIELHLTSAEVNPSADNDFIKPPMSERVLHVPV
jgi:DNA polymerase III epsilon subunit-like protein